MRPKRSYYIRNFEEHKVFVVIAQWKPCVSLSGIMLTRMKKGRCESLAKDRYLALDADR